MSKKINSKDFTGYFIGVLIFGFVFYLSFANPINFFGFNKNSDLISIEESHKKNIVLNKKAIIKPQEFKAQLSSINGVYKLVEKMPRFKSCEYITEAKGAYCTKIQIQNYIKKLKLPKEKTLYKEEKIFASFVVDEYAFIGHVKILSGNDSVLNNLVIAHIKKMPKFAKAGSHQNKEVKVQYVVPIVFNKSIF